MQRAASQLFLRADKNIMGPDLRALFSAFGTAAAILNIVEHQVVGHAGDRQSIAMMAISRVIRAIDHQFRDIMLPAMTDIRATLDVCAFEEALVWQVFARRLLDPP